MRLLGKSPNWGAVSAVIALLGLVGYHFLAPMPGTGSGSDKTIAELKDDKVKAHGDLQASKSRVDLLTWQTSRDEVTPAAMAWVSKQGQANFVDVKAFRPQRTIEAGELDQLNFLVTAEGPFLNVMRFIDSFELPESLMAVKVVQLTSLNGSDDTVRASIGLVAYQEVPERGS